MILVCIDKYVNGVQNKGSLLGFNKIEHEEIKQARPGVINKPASLASSDTYLVIIGIKV
jgi:hypothetical protein